MQSIERPELTRARPRRAASLRSAFILLFLLLTFFAVAPRLEAASCGGARPCKCGDVVTSNYLLGGNLGPCSGHGLVVKSNVALDCRGFQITGLGGTSEQYGISLSGKPGTEITGATVKGCQVSRFHRGIRLHAASNNLVGDNKGQMQNSQGMTGVHPDFQMLDVKKQGYVMAGDVAQQPWLKANFGKCDANSDGRLTAPEYTACTKK